MRGNPLQAYVTIPLLLGEFEVLVEFGCDGRFGVRWV